MAFTLVKETFKQAFQDSNQGQVGKRVYFVVSDTKILNNDEVVAAAGIPLKGSSWSISRLGLVVVRRRVIELDNGKLMFNVEVDYETPTGTGTSGSDDEDPLARPWDIQTATEKIEINIDRTKLDVIGSSLGDIELGLDKSIVNAASDPIEVRGYRYRTILTLSKNYSAFTDIDPAFTTLKELKQYEATLNDATISIGGISGTNWEHLVDEINAVNARENEVDYIRVTYRVIWDPDTHIRILLNAGLNKLEGTNRVPITNKGVPVKRPVMLDAAGQPIAATDPSVAVASGTYVAAGIHREGDLSILGLPTTFN